MSGSVRRVGKSRKHVNVRLAVLAFILATALFYMFGYLLFKLTTWLF